MTVVYHCISPKLVTPRQELPIPLFQKAINEAANGPQPAAQASICALSRGRRVVRHAIESRFCFSPAFYVINEPRSWQCMVARFHIYAHVQALNRDRARLS